MQIIIFCGINRVAFILLFYILLFVLWVLSVGINDLLLRKSVPHGTPLVTGDIDLEFTGTKL